jgi:hypothetical protein
MNAGKLAIDTEGGDAIGFLVHVTRATTPIGEPPDSGWFDRDANARVPSTFPLGIVSEVPDPNLRSFRDKLLGIEAPEPERPVADRVVEVIEVWSGDTLKRIEGDPVSLALEEIYLLHWMAAFTADSPPRFELWVETRAPWTPPSATPDFAVVAKTGGVTAIGPVANTGGWHVWWTARWVAQALTGVPDGAELTMGMAPRLDDTGSSDTDPAIGRALYNGTVKSGNFEITHASPAISSATLNEALAFAREVVRNGRLQVRAGAERKAFDPAARMFAREPGAVVWDGDIMHLAEPDERTMIILAGKVFRVRFGDRWPVDREEDE